MQPCSDGGLPSLPEVRRARGAAPGGFTSFDVEPGLEYQAVVQFPVRALVLHAPAHRIFANVADPSRGLALLGRLDDVLDPELAVEILLFHPVRADNFGRGRMGQAHPVQVMYVDVVLALGELTVLV